MIHKEMFDKAIEILKKNNIEPQYYEGKLMLDITLCDEGGILHDWFIEYISKNK